MNWLIDAQPPRRLAQVFRNVGHQARHTLDLSDGNRTPDSDIVRLAALDGSIVVTKDDDFADSFFLRGQPPKLLLVTTGNISNPDLERIFTVNLDRLSLVFEQHYFVEIGRFSLIIRR
ncbi:hypothetical protein LBMAG53_04920 [Planctomycetota bacterium]|nr:hypothetical protein LBMAG53_04920 [Planctomycetota bacterium]